VRTFAVTVDGEELRAVADLCAEHGDAHLLNVGRVLGELFAARRVCRCDDGSSFDEFGRCSTCGGAVVNR
jgi:hypothetical protein